MNATLQIGFASLLVAPICLSVSSRADLTTDKKNAFVPFVDLGTYRNPTDEPHVIYKKFDSKKISDISDGISLGALVDLIGPGYLGPNSGTGIIRWYSDDDRWLLASPHTYSRNEHLSFHPRQNESGLWWADTHALKPLSPEEAKRLVPIKQSH